MAISFITSASANANTVALAGVAANDLIFVFAYNSGSTTVPTLSSGYTSIRTAAGSAEAANLGWKVASGSETDCGTWTNATQVVSAVYRGAGGVGGNNGQASTGTSVFLQAPTLTVADGSSWVFQGVGAKAASSGVGNVVGVYGASRTNQTTCAGYDTRNGIFALSNHTLTVVGSGAWITAGVEIESILPATPNLASGQANVSGTLMGLGGGTHSVTLNWDASVDPVNGYNVYKGPISGAENILVNFDGLITGTTFTDNSANPGSEYYTVVASLNGVETALASDVNVVIMPNPPSNLILVSVS